MADPDEYAPTYTNPLTANQGPVVVSVHNLTDYAGKMFEIFTNSLAPSTKAFTRMPTLLSKGLTMPVDDVGPLAEAKVANQMMQRHIGDFQRFFGDMNNGIMAIANAAQVVAYCYDDTDGENGATIGDVGFAFADTGSRPPDGFDNRLLANGQVTTMEQSQGQAPAAAGSYSGLYGNHERATLDYSTPYSSKWTWTDGSYMTSSQSYEFAPNGTTVYVTTYTVYDTGGKVIGTRTERGSYDEGSRAATSSTEISSGTTHTRNDVTTYSDGRVRVESRAGDEAPVITETHPGDHDNGPADPGPVEEAQDMYGTSGDRESQRNYGMGY